MRAFLGRHFQVIAAWTFAAVAYLLAFGLGAITYLTGATGQTTTRESVANALVLDAVRDALRTERRKTGPDPP